MQPKIQAFFDETTFTVSYLVSDPETKEAAIIDPVLDFDPKSGRTNTHSADAILDAARAQNLLIRMILETHAHADHLSAAAYLKARTGAGVAIGKLDVEVLYTPGHTPACVSYKIGDDVFVGDTLFMPDYGTARADFPGGDAHALYRSIRKLLALPPETVLWMCHDYKAPGRNDYAWKTTVADERARNIHIRDGVSEEDFVAMRTARDKTLSMPVLILPSVQVNIRAGQMPPPEDDGKTYLKLPVNAL